nr:hypothetical protein [Tanacetum cinerariifolium]
MRFEWKTENYDRKQKKTRKLKQKKTEKLHSIQGAVKAYFSWTQRNPRAVGLGNTYSGHGRGAGFLWERVVEVMGSSGGSGGVVRSGEEVVAGLAGVQGTNKTKLTYGVAYTKLILRVKKLEHKVKTSQHKRRARMVLFDDEEDLEDPSKQGRKIAKIDENPSIPLPTELVEDLDSGENGEKEISTVILEVSIAAKNLVYIRRSAKKRKDKGKAIMKEDKSVQKKSKKQLEQERLGLEADLAHDIDWNDPDVLRYHALQNRSFSVAEVRKNMCMYLKNRGGYKQSHLKGMSYEDIRLIFERVWDQIYAFVPMDSNIEKEVMKKSGFDLQQKQFAKEVKEKKDDSSSKPVRGSRKKTVAKKRIGAKLDEESAKRQKLKDVTEEEATTEYEKEKEELRLSLKIIHNDDSKVNYKPLSRKFPIGDLRMIFDPDENDKLWMNQLDWKLLRWKLHENYGVHTLFMDGSLMKINMLVEKKYPLIKELLEKMLNLQLEAEEESYMALELIKFIKSLLEE